MRDTGFAFTTRDNQDTVTIKMSVHWNHGTDQKEITRLLVETFKEANDRVEQA